MISSLFRCPRTGQDLSEKDGCLVSQDGKHAYTITNGVPDFYIEEGASVIPPDDANRKWLDAHSVAGRAIYYERCREWHGMVF